MIAQVKKPCSHSSPRAVKLLIKPFQQSLESGRQRASQEVCRVHAHWHHSVAAQTSRDLGLRSGFDLDRPGRLPPHQQLPRSEQGPSDWGLDLWRASAVEAQLRLWTSQAGEAGFGSWFALHELYFSMATDRDGDRSRRTLSDGQCPSVSWGDSVRSSRALRVLRGTDDSAALGVRADDVGLERGGRARRSPSGRGPGGCTTLQMW